MLKAQVRADESLQLTAFRSVLDRRVRVMCQLLQTLLESRNEQLLLAAEVPVKPAVRKAKVAHKSSDGLPFRPSPSKSPQCCSHNSSSRLLLVLCAISN